ncbi:MAG TPA: pilus assembly protein PilY, partial [Telluria sp.]|nr:pilus assembly protein PilY [Telluria sp.]
MKAILCALLFACVAALADAATPLRVPDGPLGQPGARVHPNLLLNLSLTFTDAGAAYRGDYDRATDYDGYFNPRMCYRYPVKRKSASVTEPDLDERSGHFSIAKPADALHECGANTFSGNFLNWASTSALDLLRMGLTGGDRVIDEPGLTVLQRAWLPDGKAHPDFYASATYFPRRVLGTTEAGSAPRRVAPFDTATLYVVSCRNRILFSQTAKGSSCDAPRYGPSGRRIVSDKYFGEFNARVEVCSAPDAASRPALCQRYAGGFKPEGGIQRHSADARIGLMSYLTEQGADDAKLYGGVLRAPLKFVGDTSFDAPQFAAAHNKRAEWSAQSGVLAANPDQASGAVSGMINYINQLGRIRPGAYKTADPGAELYYEGLRYLQGREPSALAGGDASDAGFPVWKSRADPVTASCQRNAIAMIGHASFVEDRYLPGNTRTNHKDTARSVDVFAPGGAFDAMRAARRVGEMEADAGGAYANPAPRPDLLQLDLMDSGPAGAGSYYLAGAAYWAHTNAIRPDKPVRADSYVLELGEAAAPGASPLYLAAKYGGFDDRNGDANPYITSPARTPQSEWSVDGKTPAAYFPANDPRHITEGVRALFATALAARGRVPGTPVIASRQPDGSFVVQASYEQGSWSGGLQRIALSAGADGAIDVASTATWDAGIVLSGNAAAKPATPPRPLPAARKIFTSIRKPDQSTSTVPFTWDKLPRDERKHLDISPLSGLPDGFGEARTAYLRGDRTRESGQRDGVFRRRAGVLGDAIHSTPLPVGAASPAIQDSGYAGFYARHKSRAA